jgi:threonine/homoserine/homoserine lactone efflux protein
MLSHAIGGLLPAALAVALSPIPIVAVTLMLGTPRARTNGVGFACGWIVGLVAVSAVVLLLTHGSSTPDSSASGGVKWGTLAVGILFLSMAFRQLRKRPKKGETPEMPSWMETVDHFTAVKSTVLGVALSAANPKNLLLTATAAAAIAQQGLTSSGDVVAVAVFVVIASSTVGGSVLLYLLVPKKVSGPLDTLREFMSEHNAVIMFVVLLLLGVKLIGNGIAG